MRLHFVTSPQACFLTFPFFSSQYDLFLLHCLSPILLFLSAVFLYRDKVRNLLAELEAHQGARQGS